MTEILIEGRRSRPGAATLLVAGAFAFATAIGAPPRLLHAQPAPTAGAAEAAPVAGREDRLTQPQLEQLLAPIALYPDDLLMQVLMAATYPLEVVQAKRWLGQGQNAALRGDALAQALKSQPWDPSVKSLVPFPDVLTLMNDQLDWTQQLGDAVLAQQEHVLSAVQVLRGRAQAAGKLQSGPQQTVNVTPAVSVAPFPGTAVAPPPQVITIAPTHPDQVFVPAYDPSVVYGAWPYPSYPPAYYPPPVGWGVGNAILTGMAFAGGVAVVNSLWGWASPGWGRGDVDINVNRFNNINANRTQINNNRWRHDESHRHGVAYRNQEVRNTFRGGGAGVAENRAQAREQFRGRVQQAERGGGIGARRPDGDRPSFPDRRPGAGGNRPGSATAVRAAMVAVQVSPIAVPKAAATDRIGRAARPGRPGGTTASGPASSERPPTDAPSGRASCATGPAGGRQRAAGTRRRGARPGQPPGPACGARAGASARGRPCRRWPWRVGRSASRRWAASVRRTAMARMLRHLLIAATMFTAVPAQAQGPSAAPDDAAEPRQAAPRPIPPRTFQSPEQGFTTLIAALRAHDERALLGILGSAGQRLVRSGDRVADRAARDAVAAAFAAKNEIVRPSPKEAVLQVGEDGWPMPIPMVQRGRVWRFELGRGDTGDRRPADRAERA